MLNAIPLDQTLIGVIVILAVSGLAAGFFSGLLGIGGGGILVPVLYEVFGFLEAPDDARMHLAVGTSLAIMVPTTVRSYFSHRSRGGTDGSIVRRLAIPILVGVVLGTLIAKWAPGTVLKWIWVIFSTLMVIRMLFGRASWRLGDDLPKNPVVELYAVLVGTISTVMSIGGGAYITAMLTLYGRSIQQAVGTSTAFAPMIALPGMIGFIWAGWSVPDLPAGSIGYFHPLVFAAMVPTSVLMAPVGARLAHRFSARGLEIVMGLFIMAAASRFVVAIFHGG